MKTARTIFQSLRARARIGILIEGAACLALAAAVYVFLSYALDRSLRLETGFRVCLLALLAFALVRVYLARVHRPIRIELDDDEIALAVERHDPDIHESLISAVQFDRELAIAPGAGDRSRHGESRTMMSTVVADVERRLHTMAFHRALDRRRVQRFTALLIASLVLVIGWALAFPSEASLWARRNLGFSAEPWPRDTYLAFLDVDVDVPYRLAEREDLTLRVRADGVVPERVVLYCDFAGGEVAERQMDRTGDDVFSLTLESLLEDAELRAYGGDGSTRTLRIQLVPRPRITDLQLTLTYPDYMGREPEQVAETGGDLRVPRGGAVRIAARSSKPLRRASMTFAQDQHLPAEVVDGGAGLQASFAPTESGALRIDVLDEDDLGPNQPPLLYLRVVEDTAPRLDFTTDGIGTLITSVARIPGMLKIRDDYGLRTVSASFQIGEAQLPEPGEQPRPPSPFEPADVAGLDQFQPGGTEFFGELVFDLKPMSPGEDENSEQNRIRPGHIVGLRFAATDNFAPDAHTGESETLNFRVVTREKLLEELRRRQTEQRRELERVLEKEIAAKAELGEIISPAENDPRVTQARLRILALARQQNALGMKVKGIGERYRQILLEMQNNRLFEPNIARSLDAMIVSPLMNLATDDFPTSAERTAAFADSGEDGLRTSVVDAYTRIIAVIEQVLLQMEKTEDLAAIIETLRIVIRTEQEATDLIEDLRNRQGEGIFDPNPDDAQSGRGKNSGDGKETKKQ